ncbi:mediator of RNA polymerase II transcription subunit 12-like [Dorcoceras hygrometricum]|uniref:Mediator of RNA polymerase II transcription subunit 12-like n=1 Tax=Dorcoceras hygrometricum TaxID=472368 RepID=A0A2Z7CVB3_9LAMI|nr:mediator of RNA polymerase II transcription subunit 12-like [Dorcoceras hygrometricum]
MMRALKGRQTNVEENPAHVDRQVRGREKPRRTLGPVVLDFIHHMVPKKDFDLVRRTSDLKVIEAASLHLMPWYGVVKRQTASPHNDIIMNKRSVDGLLNRHNDLMNQLEKLQAQKDEEKKSLLLELQATRAEVQSSEARAQSSEAQAQRSKEENKGPQAEVKKFTRRERASVYFKHGFNGCLAQFRANDYSEDEHPTLFLDVVQALDDMPKEGEMVEEDSSGSEAAPSS